MPENSTALSESSILVRFQYYRFPFLGRLQFSAELSGFLLALAFLGQALKSLIVV